MSSIIFESTACIDINIKNAVKKFIYYQIDMRSKEVIRILRQNGFEQDRQRGSHKHFRHSDGRKVVVPDHGTKDLKVGTLQNIEKTSGIKMR